MVLLLLMTCIDLGYVLDILVSGPAMDGIQLYDCTAFHYTEPFIVTSSSSRYDLNTIVERDGKQIVIIIIIIIIVIVIIIIIT